VKDLLPSTPLLVSSRPMLQRGTGNDSVGSQVRPLEMTTSQERILMAAHSIELDGFGFRFGGYRYDCLSDAVHASMDEGKGCE